MNSFYEAVTLFNRLNRHCHRPEPSTMGFDYHGARKRRREAYNVDTKLVEIYEDLASEKDEIRLKAAQGLISQFTPDKNPTDDQIKKTLQRLFRGLCSSRKAARIGFSVALTELLTQIFSVKREDAEFSFDDVLKIWASLSNSSGSESGQVGVSQPPSTLASLEC